MSCYGCGSPRGDAFKLCPECIVRRRHERAKVKADALGQHRKEQSPNDDVVHNAMSSMPVKFAGLGVLLLFLIGFFMLWGPLAQHGVVPSLLFAVMVASGIVSLLIWLLFWSQMMIMDTMWAIASFLIPCCVYKYVVARWDEDRVRVLFFAHGACLAVSLLCAASLAQLLEVSPLEVLSFYKQYMHGEQAEVPQPAGILKAPDENDPRDTADDSHYNSGE